MVLIYFGNFIYCLVENEGKTNKGKSAEHYITAIELDKGIANLI